MEWFLKLESSVQIWLVAVGGAVVLGVAGNVVGFLKAVFAPAPPNEDWFTEYVKRMPKINEGSFHTHTVTKTTMPKGGSAGQVIKPPQGGSGTAPPKLKVTRYFIRHSNGMFYTNEPGLWVAKSAATYWTDPVAAHDKADQMNKTGIRDIKVVADEVEE